MYKRTEVLGKVPHYTGKDELAAVYDYSSADAEKLEEGGMKRLQELQNYKKCEMTIRRCRSSDRRYFVGVRYSN